MQKYILASLKIINDTTCYLYPQFEYDGEGKLHNIENKKSEFPERGTIFLPKKPNEDLSGYLNKLIKILGSIIFFVGLTLPRYRFSKPSASLDMNLR